MLRVSSGWPCRATVSLETPSTRARVWRLTAKVSWCTDYERDGQRREGDIGSEGWESGA